MAWRCVDSLLKAERKVVSAQGPYIYANRNLLLEKAKYEQDSLLMVDSDIIYTKDQVDRIESHLDTLDAITGLYVVGKEPYPPCIFKRTEGDYELTEPPKELAEIDACGGGFLGLSKKLVQELPNEAFNDIWEGKVKHGEDISFCHRLKELNYKLWCDPFIKVGHIRITDIRP